MWQLAEHLCQSDVNNDSSVRSESTGSPLLGRLDIHSSELVGSRVEYRCTDRRVIVLMLLRECVPLGSAID